MGKIPKVFKTAKTLRDILNMNGMVAYSKCLVTEKKKVECLLAKRKPNLKDTKRSTCNLKYGCFMSRKEFLDAHGENSCGGMHECKNER